MPLNKMTVGFPFSGGLSTKAADHVIPQGKLLELENAVFDRPGSLRKRNGYRSLSNRISGGNTRITDGRAVMTYRDELLEADGQNLYSYDVSSERWIEKGPLVSVAVTQRPVSKSGQEQWSQDSAAHSLGLQAFVWQESGGVYYSLVDSSTGQTLVGRTLIDAHGQSPRVLVIKNLFVFLYYDTLNAKLLRATLPVATPQATLAPVALTSSIADANSMDAGAPNFDAYVFNDHLFLAFNNNTAAQSASLWRFGYSDLLNPISKATTDSTTNPTSLGVLSIFPVDDSGDVMVIYNDTSLGATLYYAVFTSILQDASGTVLLVAQGTADTGATGENQNSITGWYVAPTGGRTFDARLYCTDTTNSPSNVRVSRITSTPADHTSGVFLEAVSLAGKAFAVDGTVYVPLSYESAQQPTYFLANQDGTIVGPPILGEVAGTVATSLGEVTLHPLPSATVVGEKVQIALRSQQDTSAGIYKTVTGVTSVSLDFAGSYPHVEAANGLLVGGGCLWLYDGHAPAELGFLVFPELNAPSTGHSGTTYTYSYTAVYEWEDATGQIHWSAPAEPVALTTSLVINSSNAITLSGTTLHLTAKAGVKLVYYRTPAGETTYYRVGEADSAGALTDTTDDATLKGNPVLYTDGGVVENIIPPPVGALTVHRNRVYLVDSESPLTIWFSKPLRDGAPVEFSDAMVMDVDPQGGDITALASLDDKLVVFKQNRVFVITGQGPDETGSNNDFSDAMLIVADVGCVNAASIVRVPDGIIFQSKRGLCLLDRGLSVEYIGTEVERYAGETITSAVLMEDSSRVVFTLGNRQALVYDTLVQQWGTFTNVTAADSVLHAGLHTLVRADGVVMVETPGGFTDDGSFISLKATTSWLQFAGLQGVQRVYRAQILADYHGPSKLNVSVAYDFNPNPIQSGVITISGPAAYGEGGAFGVESPFGGTYPDAQRQIYPVHQQCEAIQFTISDAPDGTPNEGLSLNGISLLVGVRKGLRRLSAAKTVGSEG